MSAPVQTPDPPTGSRPSRDEIAPAAADLLRRRRGEILATARRYAATPEDADDAFQRGLEILLTKAPTTDEHQLVPWLKTVVKHEAFALKRQRERAVAVEHDALDAMSEREAPADEHAERHEQLRIGAEALEQLKPQETRALLLRAQGYSYSQIQEITGWTYTKVNRCLTEGRRSFLQRVWGIESGAECKRLEPLISKFADGEADANEVRVLRPHLRGCAACRATLADYRRAPAAAAELATPAILAAAGIASGGPLAGAWESLVAWLHERALLLSTKAHAAVEIATTHKAAAVAASTAALAGGGAATVERLDREPVPRRAPAASTPRADAPANPSVRPRPRKQSLQRATRAAEPQRSPSPAAATPPAPAGAQPEPAAVARPRPAAAPREPASSPEPPAGDGGEFGP